MNEIESPLPVVIDCDLINTLKRSGRKDQADLLLSAYHADRKKAGRQARLDLMKVDRIIKKFKGVCSQLGCFTPTTNRSICHKHYTIRKQQQEKIRIVKDKKGQCVDCKRKRLPNYTVCRYHNIIRNENTRDRTFRQKSQGLCTQCNDTAVEERNMCQQHLDAAKERYYLQLRKGLCVNCGLPTISNQTRCELHRRQQNKRVSALYYRKKAQKATQ